MSESHFNANYELLKKKNPGWAEVLLAQHTGEAEIEGKDIAPLVDVVESKNGQPNIISERNGQKVYYHSRYDPSREAVDIVNNSFNPKYNYFAVLGLGMGYTVEALLDRAEAKVFIVEPNMRAFLEAMEHRDLSKILDSDKVGLSIGQEWKDAFTSWSRSTSFHELSGVGIIELPGAMKAAPDDYFEGFKEKLKAYIVTLGGNLQTMMLKGWEYQRNTLVSLPKILTNPPIRTLFDSFRNKPAIIVSAGPSLSKNIDQIGALKGKAVIIGVDTSLKPLLKAGIEPDFICTGDPQLANYKHLAGAKVDRSQLVAEPMTHPQSLIDFDQKLFIASYGDKMMQWLGRGIGDVGRVMCWGSVATMAFDLARKFGCDPIIFTGQDLSFTGGRTYVEGTYFEDENKQDMSAEAFAKREKTYEMPDIFGGRVLTNRQMFAYLNWFNYEISLTEARVVNASEGGILKEGVEILTLAEAADKYLGEEFDTFAQIERARNEFDGYSTEKLEANIKAAIESLGRIREICESGLLKVKKTVNKLRDMEHYPMSICHEAIKNLDNGRQNLSKETAMKDFLEFANQIGMYNFLRRYTKLQGSKFSKRIMDDTMDLFSDLYFSMRKTIGTVNPFFEQALKSLQNGEDK